MKIVNIVIVSTMFLLGACSAPNQEKGHSHEAGGHSHDHGEEAHGHAHGEESHGHEHGDAHEHHAQEEFVVGQDSLMEDTHDHDHDHDGNEADHHH
ncbi:hypothetical protein KFE94_05410 [bacterium SCSIO 12643]|nr:hypothetical protein KFE94_05410 [bacterium SCSIO 12643]